MAIADTGLQIQASPIPTTFRGTPQQFFEAMVRRMKIVSATGVSFIFTGDAEPSSNVGPWLKDGTKWYVFDNATKRYVPLDISDSEETWYHIGATTPPSSDPPVWLRTSKDPTTSDPSVGVPIGWYLFNGTAWESFIGIVPSGTTANRPVSPQTFQQYYDADISCLIWFERGAWRTVSGVPGDIKHVAFETLTEALTANPGWEFFGAANSQFRGRVIVQAAKDPGGSPESSFTVGTGITSRAAFETFGGLGDATAGVEPDASAPTIAIPAQIALWTLVKV